MQILLQIDDENLRDKVQRALLSGGHSLANRDAQAPDAILLGEIFQERSGRQRAISLRAQATFFERPIVAIAADTGVQNVLRWLRVGAVDVLSPDFDIQQFEALVEECQNSRIHTAPLRSRVLSYARRQRLHGTLLAYADTPFEAQLRFDEGELSQSKFMMFSGSAALDATLELEDANLSWQAGDSIEPAARPLFEGQSRILVIEDDDALRVLTVKRLEAAGYKVQSASDGKLGLEMALADSFDAAIVDLSLPSLDGWGILRQMNSNLAAREIAVMVISAHTDFVDTLKAARAGARAYLHKSGRAKDLLQSIDLLTQPRKNVRSQLAGKRSIDIETRSIGTVWLLKALAELDCSGTLELEDELGRYEITVAQGQLIEAIAQVGSMRYQGDLALEAVICARATGRFTVKKLNAEVAKPWVFEVVDRVCKSLSEGINATLAQSIQRVDRLMLNSELAQLYGQIASVQDLKILESVTKNPASIEVLSTQLQIPAHEIEASLAELLRRGVFEHRTE